MKQIPFSHRALNTRETQFLQERIQELPKENKRMIRKQVGMGALLIVLGGLANWLLWPSSFLPIAFFVGVVIIIMLWISFDSVLKNNSRKEDMEQLLQKNQISSLRIQPIRYYELEDPEDFGEYYLFQTAANQIVAFGGQEYYPTDVFPSEDFEIAIIFYAQKRIVYHDIYTYGNKKEPSRLIPKNISDRLLFDNDYPNLEHFILIESDLESFTKRLTDKHHLELHS